MPTNKRTVFVTGDVTIDWNIARSRSLQGSTGWNGEQCTRAYWETGGAALLGRLAAEIAKGLASNGITCDVITPKVNLSEPNDPRFHHSYAMWQLSKFGAQPQFSREKPAWRVDEFLGIDRARLPLSEKVGANAEDASTADVVVITDANLGFRDQERLWPKLRSSHKKPRWIVVKMSQPIAQGALWQKLQPDFADRIIVVTTVNELRLSEVQISRELSWELTAQDLAWEIVYNPRINSLSRCAYVVVAFGAAGAILFTNTRGAAPVGTLVFDPTVVEGMWEQRHENQVAGSTSCITAALLAQLMAHPDDPNILQGTQNGLAAMRRLHLEGYGKRGTEASDAELYFPLTTIADELSRNSTAFSVAEIENPVRNLVPADQAKPNTSGYWTILEQRFTQGLDQVAERIVLHGVESALRDVPLGHFGKLVTVDRREIEAFRSIRTLIREYCNQPTAKRPLSIAVFGAPGAGKSFGIIEVANSLQLQQPVEKREFNLSQFRSQEELLDALHQVRDVGLSGAIPLVFWDEFDTSLNNQPLGWLRYFLAPMQDGKFQQGQITHPIGRAIFVFAGGTSETMQLFDRGASDPEFRAVKGPDFVSRLKGFVNILGPNPKTDVADPFFLIRRAILLRSILARDARQFFNRRDGKDMLEIDSGVLRALLQTRRYKHGVRSMESILAMSTLSGKRRFERSALPSEAQLELHVEAQDFLSILQRMELEGEFLERLASAAHEVFCEDLRLKGYKAGTENNVKRKTHSALKDYLALPEDEKEQNRANVRDIAGKLAIANYVMIPARSNEPAFNFPGADLERLAEMEHDRWMRLKLDSGWRYARVTNKEQRLHQALIPWRKTSAAEREQLYAPYHDAVGSGVLPESEKEKDRLLVRSIPRILARAGYTVIKAQHAANATQENNDLYRSNGTPASKRSRQAQRRSRKRAGRS